MLTVVFASAIWSFSVCLQRDGLLHAQKSKLKSASFVDWSCLLVIEEGFRFLVTFGDLLESLSSGSSWSQKRRPKVIRASVHRVVRKTRTPLLSLKMERELRGSGILCLGSNYLVIHRIVAKLLTWNQGKALLLLIICFERCKHLVNGL